MPRMVVQLHVMKKTVGRRHGIRCSCLSLIGEELFTSEVGLKEPMLSLQRQLVSGTAAVTGRAVHIALPSGELLEHMPSSAVVEYLLQKTATEVEPSTGSFIEE